MYKYVHNHYETITPKIQTPKFISGFGYSGNGISVAGHRQSKWRRCLLLGRVEWSGNGSEGSLVLKNRIDLSLTVNAEKICRTAVPSAIVESSVVDVNSEVSDRSGKIIMSLQLVYTSARY